MFVHLKIYTLKSNPEGIIIDGIILVHFQGKPFNITVYAPVTDAKEAEVDWFCEDLQHCLELTHTHTHKVLFIITDLNAKVGSQELPRITGKFCLTVQNEAGKRITVLSREYADHSKHSFPTTQEIILHMDITRWPIQKSDMFFAAEDRAL